MTSPLPQRLAAEAIGTAFLVATVVGSGIMAETLARDAALALLANTLATGAMLVVLITTLGPISGAHFNPAISLIFALKGDLPRREASFYALGQIVGGIAGTFSGIHALDLPGFIAAEFAGALLALAAMNWLLNAPADSKAIRTAEEQP